MRSKARTHPVQPQPQNSRRELICIAATAAAAGLALGYMIAHFNGNTLDGLARIASIVALVLLASEVRIGRGLARIERRLHSRLKAGEYAEGYVDGLQRRPPGDGGGRHLHSA